ncbi:amino acid ABC transporter ATP-binding/permease protein [Sphingomonas aerolata]|uniref:amino acid ABC transporter ATP-binding/permease protein n=1 Tax=Sphingomonas aerolata TaxID=185951 RepID=UPI002FE133E2
MNGPLDSLLAQERRAQRPLLARAALLAAVVAAASVLLLGLSGWFITAAAIAGLAGPAAALAFNYMLPSAGIRLLAILRTGARYGERLASHEAAFGALARIRPAIFRALAAQPAGTALAFGTGEATARLIGDVDAMEMQFVRQSAPWGVAAALITGFGLVSLGSVAASIATACCMAVLLIVADRLARRSAPLGKAVQYAAGALRETFAGLADAAPELRCFGLEPWAAAQVDDRSRALAAAQRAQAEAAGWLDLLHATAVGIAAASAAILSAGSGAPWAALAALAAAMTIDAGTPVLRAMIERGRMRAARDRLDDILENHESTETYPEDASPRALPNTTGSSHSALHFVLPAGTCHVRHGDRVALTGPSGIGKTTLVERLLSLRPSTPGEIWLDGDDIGLIPAEISRRSFAWAPQDAALLSGTVRDNLMLANPDADDATLWRALHDAVLDDRVRALDQGLDAWVGENGARLSGGERRRLAVARAYCSLAPWLVLDEPSEGLDRTTEKLLAVRLAQRLDTTGQGLILVSHRPALVALCPQRFDLTQAGSDRRSAA